MNGICRDTSNDLLSVAKDLENYRDLLDLWLNGDETQTVLLGGVLVPTIRKLVHDIDERESQGAQTIVDEGIQGMYVIKDMTEKVRDQVIQLKNEIQAKIDLIHAMTATATTLQPGQQATAFLNTTTNTLQLGIPQGEKGADGPIGPTGPGTDHQWVGTQLQFSQSDGTWGDLVNLLGPAGPTGPQGIPGPVTHQSLDMVDCGGAFQGESVINIDCGVANSDYTQ